MPRPLCAALLLLHAAAAHGAVQPDSAHLQPGSAHVQSPADTSSVQTDSASRAHVLTDIASRAHLQSGSARLAPEQTQSAIPVPEQLDSASHEHVQPNSAQLVSGTTHLRRCFSCGPESVNPGTNCSQRTALQCPPARPRCASLLTGPNVTSLSCTAAAAGVAGAAGAAGEGAGGARCLLTAAVGWFRLECACDANRCNAPFTRDLAARLLTFTHSITAANATDYTDAFFNFTNRNVTLFEATTTSPVAPEMRPRAEPLRQEPTPPDDDEDETEGSGSADDRARPAPPAPSPPRPAHARAPRDPAPAALAAALAGGLLISMV